MRSDPVLQFNGIGLDPAEDGGVVHLDIAIQQHEFEIAVTDGEHQIPSDRPQDHLSGERPALEGLILPHLSRLSPFRHGTDCTWPRSRRKAATEPEITL
jgi:hypothetical protein